MLSFAVVGFSIGDASFFTGFLAGAEKNHCKFRVFAAVGSINDKYCKFASQGNLTTHALTTVILKQVKIKNVTN